MSNAAQSALEKLATKTSQQVEALETEETAVEPVAIVPPPAPASPVSGAADTPRAETHEVRSYSIQKTLTLGITLLQAEYQKAGKKKPSASDIVNDALTIYLRQNKIDV